MNEILSSLKSDLLDRRMLPILLALGVLLAGAVAYVVLAGGGTSEAGAPAAAVAAPSPTPTSSGSAPAVTQAPANPNAAVAETTDGARYRHKPGSHDPFTPLASPQAKSAATTSASSVPSPSSSSTSTSVEKSSPSSPSTGGATTTPSTPVKPAAPKKPKTVYLVTVQFGLLPSTPGELSQLTPYPDLKRLQPLPSKDDPRLLFAGARGNGKGAVFALSREAILKGQAICIPSASQCESIDLAVGQSEELTYLEADGQSVPYELKVVSIVKESPTASAARVHHRRRHHHQ
jgi:hypothetical protein